MGLSYNLFNWTAKKEESEDFRWYRMKRGQVPEASSPRKRGKDRNSEHRCRLEEKEERKKWEERKVPILVNRWKRTRRRELAEQQDPKQPRKGRGRSAHFINHQTFAYHLQGENKKERRGGRGRAEH